MEKLKMGIKLISALLIVLAYQNCSPYRGAGEGEFFLSSEGLVIDENPYEDEERGAIFLPTSKLRALSGQEYINSVSDLTGSQPDAQYDFSDVSSGFATGTHLTIDKNLMASFILTSDKQAKIYVDGPMEDEHSCAQSPNDDCYRNIILNFAEKAYRRPLSSEERQKYSSLYGSLKGELESGKEALYKVIARVLLSPHFLYRREIGEADGSGVRTLTSFEKASYLSYSLTGHPPDEQLYQAAKNGELEGQMTNHAQRLLASERSQKWLNQFFRGWLQLDSLNQMKMDLSQFPKIANQKVADSLNGAFDAFVQNMVFDRGATLTDLMTTDQAMVNQYTAPFYGLEVSGEQLRPVNTDRMGVLTLASVMSSHSSNSDPERDNPVSRGLMIRAQMLCEPIGIPSGINLNEAAGNVSQQHPNYESYTVRKQYEAMMQQGQSCVSCHAQFMPYGYMFSNFDAFGRYNTTQKAQAIDASSMAFLNGQEKQYDDIYDFIPEMVNSPRFQRCFSEKIGAFLIGDYDEVTDGNLQWLFFDQLRNGGLGVKAAFINAFNDENFFRRRGE